MERAKTSMIVSSISLLVCVCVFFALTVVSGRAPHAKPLHIEQRDELAPVVSSLAGIGLSMNDGFSAMAASIAKMEVQVNAATYVRRAGFPDDGRTSSCSGTAANTVAGLARFTSIVKAVASITNMQAADMCSSGAIKVTVEHLKRKLTGASCQGVVDAMNASAASASELTKSAVAELALAIADATCVGTEIDETKLKAVLDGVDAALCSPSSEAEPCAGIVAYSAATANVYVKRLVRALATAARAYAIERSTCKETIARVDAMDFTAIAALVRNNDITLACAKVGKKMAASATPAAADAVAYVLRSALVSVVCADHSALALMTPNDIKGLVVSIVRAMCAGEDKKAVVMTM